MLLGVARAAENGGGDTKKIWAEGVDYFDRGEFSKARRKFDQLVKLVDTNVAAKLVKRAGMPTMVRMLSSTKLGRAPKVIWELYSKYYRRRLIDAERITKQVNLAIDEKTHEVKRVKALHELRRIGQYAVPELAKHLSARSSERRALVRIALSRIGDRGTLAMVKLLPTGNDLFKETLALSLSDIKPADTRAVPALKRLYDNPNTNPTVRQKVAYALHKITGLSPNDMAGYADYYYLLANRYYLEKAGVPEEALESDGVIWELTGDKKNPALTYRRVPIYSWNEEIAEDILHDCLSTKPTYERALPLMLSIQLAQAREIDAIEDAIKIGGKPVTMTSNDTKVLAERAKLLIDTNLLAEACGPRYLYRAVGKALRDGRPRVCAAAIDLLPLVDPYGKLLPPAALAKPLLDKRGRPIRPTRRKAAKKKAEKEKKKKKETRKRRWWQRSKKEATSKKTAAAKPAEGLPPELMTSAEVKPEHEGQPLIDALSCGDDGVRVSAAIALAKMDQVRPFPGSAKVVAALADAISKSGPVQILVVMEDDDAFKLLKPMLVAHELGVTRATSGRDALNKAKSFPPKDLILISTKIKANLAAKGTKEAPGLFDRLKSDPKLAVLPVAILVAKDNLAAELAKFGNIPVVLRSSKDHALKVEVQKALGSTGPGVTKQKREDLAARAARALLEIDQRRTQLRVGDAASACQKALFNRPDAVRNPCIRALGLFVVKAAAKDLVKLFNDRNNTIELRRNCLYALGQTAAVENKALFLKAEREESDFSLRNAASIAHGKSQLIPEPAKLVEFLMKARIKRTTEGGDGRPAHHKSGKAPAAAPAAPAAAPAADK
jgi:CheY-like chemotaxis protein